MKKQLCIGAPKETSPEDGPVLVEGSFYDPWLNESHPITDGRKMADLGDLRRVKAILTGLGIENGRLAEIARWGVSGMRCEDFYAKCRNTFGIDIKSRIMSRGKRGHSVQPESPAIAAA